MKNIIFIVSHFCSRSFELISFLNKNPRIEIQTSGLSYDHPSVLEHLFNKGHKLDNAAAIYGDHILHNHNFSSKAFYNFSKFIYVIRSAKSSLKEFMYEKKDYSAVEAGKYYAFRLRRMYEMAKNTPGSVFLTYDNISNNKGADLIENYLNLKENIVFGEFANKETIDLPADVINFAEDCYEKYLYYFKQLDLKLVN